MKATLALVSVGAAGHGAVGSRINSFADGLTARGWWVDVIDVASPHTSRMDDLLDRTPNGVRRVAEGLGFEGDIMPRTFWCARSQIGRISADVAVVSVPPFSLLAAARCLLPQRTALVVDYRDPWGARQSPPALVRLTRHIERLALRRAAAVTYAGGPDLGDRLVQALGVPAGRVVSVPNGFDKSDLDGVPRPRIRSDRDGEPLDLVSVGYWYGRNGPVLLPEVLAEVGQQVANLTVIGGISSPIEARFQQTLGWIPKVVEPQPRGDLYRRLARADAAVICLDRSSAIESRIPAKVYDYLAVGVPVISMCPSDAALLSVDGAERFHRFEHTAVDAAAEFLRDAAHKRSKLRVGPPGACPSRDQAVGVLSAAIEVVLPAAVRSQT